MSSSAVVVEASSPYTTLYHSLEPTSGVASSASPLPGFLSNVKALLSYSVIGGEDGPSCDDTAAFAVAFAMASAMLIDCVVPDAVEASSAAVDIISLLVLVALADAIMAAICSASIVGVYVVVGSIGDIVGSGVTGGSVGNGVGDADGLDVGDNVPLMI